jgi:8-oxo-dGTP diphosphatase
MHIHVTCAVIRRDGLILAARRSASMAMPLKWEFPGGKIHPGETPEDCLRRELQEELGITAAVGSALPLTRHDYPEFTITLYPFECTIEFGDPVAREHDQLLWLLPNELPALDWAEADIPIVQSLRGTEAPR